MKKKFDTLNVTLCLALVLYIVGAFFIKSESYTTNIHREDYSYTDSDGEEHEDILLITLPGIGKILTYQDIYFSSIPFFFISMIIGAFVMGKGVETNSSDSLKHIIFANCILGVLLIALSDKTHVWSTIFFWLGIISAYISSQCSEKT